MKGALTAIIFGTGLYALGLWGGACGVAKMQVIRAEKEAYDKGYQDGARALHRYLQEIKARNNPEA